jgi:hypothetical protein
MPSQGTEARGSSELVTLLEAMCDRNRGGSGFGEELVGPAGA